jgi:hypothetical protein
VPINKKTYFSLGLKQEPTDFCTSGLLSRQLGDTFFEPLPEEKIQQWE